MPDNLFNIDDYLKNALQNPTLKELFDNKLDELKLTKTNVQEILDMPYRTLHGILEGSQKLVDVTSLIKIADFLQLPKENVFKLYVDSLQRNPSVNNVSPKKIKFIKENFDLVVLKKAGLINDLNDFEHIEERISRRLGYKSIYEYSKPSIDVAFSSGLFKPKNLQTRLFWIRSAMCALEQIDNPNEYDRQALIKFFPHILWYTTNEERGLSEVIRTLFKIGVTVIYQPNLQGLQLRGATFNVSEKPCIVLTDYKGFYSTIWFCLIHELYHVLFDWEDLKNDSYHLTDVDNEELSVQEREKQADKFAREFLISGDKMLNIKHRISDEHYVRRFAEENNVHHSIVYAFYAFTNDERKDWARTKKYSPLMKNAIKNLDYPWEDKTSLEEYVIEKKELIYN